MPTGYNYTRYSEPHTASVKIPSVESDGGKKVLQQAQIDVTLLAHVTE